MEDKSMSYIRPTSSASPFATSTAFNTQGPTAFNQSWMTVTGSAPPVASLSGSAVANTGWSGASNSGRIYFENNDHYEQSAASYYTSFQVYVSSIDELIAGGNSFKHLYDSLSVPTADTANSRTNIIRTGF